MLIIFRQINDFFNIKDFSFKVVIRDYIPHYWPDMNEWINEWMKGWINEWMNEILMISL